MNDIKLFMHQFVVQYVESIHSWIFKYIKRKKPLVLFVSFFLTIILLSGLKTINTGPCEVVVIYI